MTKPHRATPEQWESIEVQYADFSDFYSCFLELRARIEALEAAQQPHQDKMDRLIAIDRDDPANSPVERIATDTFRALCAELVSVWDSCSYSYSYADATNRMTQYITEARAALAQSEPVAPTDEAIMELMPQQFRDDLATVSRLAAHGTSPDVTPGIFWVSLNTGALDFARAVLARYGTPAIAAELEGQ